jgi:hypothetical protein
MADPVLEKTVEAYLVREVAKIGGIAEKFTSPGRRSVPDRLVQFPIYDQNREKLGKNFQHMIFVEVKAPGKKATENQKRDHDRRRAMGFRVEVLDSKEAVDEFIRSVS